MTDVAYHVVMTENLGLDPKVEQTFESMNRSMQEFADPVSMALSMAAVEPFPFVPAICT